MKQIITLLGLSLILSLSTAQNNWSFEKETNLLGSISGTILQGYVFKTFEGDFYIVNEYTIQIVITISPEVKILKKGSDYKLIIEDFDEPIICKKLNNVIETQIDGEFEGWDGETIFKLMNGQIWQQSSYQYMYHYSYCPQVLIYEFNDTWNMKVEDVDASINVVKLK